MKPKKPGQGKQGGMPKGKLLLGAAGLFLFIVGVRRTFRTEHGEVGALPPGGEEPGEGGEPSA